MTTPIVTPPPAATATPADRVTIPKTRPSGRDDRFWAKMEASDARHKAQIKRMEKKLDAFGDRLLLQCSSILFAAFALAVAAIKYLP